MAATLLTSVFAYISTNIDDIVVLMILLAQAEKSTKGKLAAGHFLGVGILTAMSLLGALGLQNLPLNYVGILGLVPIFLGIRAWRHGENSTEASAHGTVNLMSMAMITLGNGADNLGLYIPLFTGFSGPERVCAAAVFAIMTALWLRLADALAELPVFKDRIIKFKPVLIPAVFVLLGVYIILDSGLLC